MVSEGTLHFAKVACVVLAGLLAINAYNDWSDERAVVAARAAMTPAQRAASDTARSQHVAAEAAVAQQQARQARFRDACMRSLLDVLHDPGSAQLTWSAGSIDANGVYNGFIEGRAKNAFGALILGAWHCQAVGKGEAVAVISMSQYRP